MSTADQSFIPAITETDDEYPIVPTFDDMNLNEKLLRGIYSYGFEKPSPIQQRAIMPIIAKRDVLAQAQSGTGKTGTFSIGILERIDVTKPHCQALILAPIRELARQIQDVIQSLGSYMGVKVHALIGGTDAKQDQEILRAGGVHVAVGTPGRVLDMINRGSLDLSKVEIIVVDEADQMLDKGFKDQLYEIFTTENSNNNAQLALFSATLPAEALQMIDQFMRNPVRILIQKEQLTLDGIKQFYVELANDNEKFAVLTDIYGQLPISQAIIYCNTRRRVEELKSFLESEGFTVSATHGDMEQKDREFILKEFRSGTSRVLVTTDLLARGIDVQQVSVVINFEIPSQRENYIHRIGRSGRFGRKGLAINLVNRNTEKSLIEDIEAFYHTSIDSLPANFAEYA